MSDHDGFVYDTGYDTPVPELDDHRHFSSSSLRNERPRRGTFDSLYGPRLFNSEGGNADVRVRDFEEAIVDGDAEPQSPKICHRCPTFESSHSEKAVSPPNSVKAFAQARRRERDIFSKDEQVDSESLLSASSRRSRRSKCPTATDAASLLTNKTAEEDVCFPLQDHCRKNQLHIDFDYLENFINAERESHSQQGKSEEPAELDKLNDAPVRSAGNRPMQLATVDGDVIDLPPEYFVPREKDKAAMEDMAARGAPWPPVDNNRFSFFSSAWESTIHASEMGDLVLPGEDIRNLFTLPEDEGDGVWWLNVNRATKDEVRGVCKAFGIHPLTIEDIVTQEAREKIELFPSYYFACFRSFNVVEEEDGTEYEPFNIYVTVFREGTLSFSFAPNSHAAEVRKRITALKDYVALSSDWICYALIDNIVDSFAPVIHQIEMEADAIDDEVFVMREDDSNSFLRTIGRVRKNCMALLRLLGGKADVLRGFTKRCNENYQVTPRMDIGMYLGDIQDHVVTMATNLGHFEKILSRAHSNYLATLSINNLTQGTDMNRVLSKITFLASVLVPMNLVCGAFGMNVDVPFRDVGNLGPFFAILGIMLAVCVLILIWARRRRWI